MSGMNWRRAGWQQRMWNRGVTNVRDEERRDRARIAKLKAKSRIVAKFEPAPVMRPDPSADPNERPPWE